jgi:hypothetical protein
MPLTEQPRLITDQLSQAIREMGDFLLENPFDGEHYKILYEKIDRLTLKAKREGYFDYKHDNQNRTLTEFLNQGDTKNLILKYYSLPSSWKRVLIKQPKLTKVIRGGKKLVEFVADIAGRVINPR